MEKQRQAMPYFLQEYEERKFQNSDIEYGNSYAAVQGFVKWTILLNSFEKSSLKLPKLPENQMEREIAAEGFTICWQEREKEWN